MKLAALRLALVGVLAGATLLGSAAVLATLSGGGALRLGGWTVLELAAGYDREATADLRSSDPAARARVAESSRRALALNPYDTAAWLRLAVLDYMAHGRLTAEGVGAMKRAYDLIEIDPYAATWRVGFALERWADLPPDLKAAVRNEAMTLAAELDHRDKILSVLAHVRNPRARLTAAMWIARIEMIGPK